MTVNNLITRQLLTASGSNLQDLCVCVCNERSRTCTSNDSYSAVCIYWQVTPTLWNRLIILGVFFLNYPLISTGFRQSAAFLPITVTVSLWLQHPDLKAWQPCCFLLEQIWSHLWIIMCFSMHVKQKNSSFSKQNWKFRGWRTDQNVKSWYTEQNCFSFCCFVFLHCFPLFYSGLLSCVHLFPVSFWCRSCALHWEGVSIVHCDSLP